jgi:hypothetical protein
VRPVLGRVDERASQRGTSEERSEFSDERLREERGRT